LVYISILIISVCLLAFLSSSVSGLADCLPLYVDKNIARVQIILFFPSVGTQFPCESTFTAVVLSLTNLASLIKKIRSL